MIRSVTIENLRGIRHGTLDNLTPLVILVGPNNSGKSTVLDGVYMAAHRDPGGALRTIVHRRAGLNRPERWLPYLVRGLPVGHPRGEIHLQNGEERVCELVQHGADSWGVSEVQRPRKVIDLKPSSVHAVRSEGLEVQLVDPVTDFPMTSLVALYSRVAERGLRKVALDIVSELVPGVESMELLQQDDAPALNLVFPSGARPTVLEGTGVQMLIRQALELAAPAGGVVLMEEPESHMHPGAMRQSARAIWAAIKRDIQVIISTHSLDFIDLLLEQTPDGLVDRLSLYRLALNDGELLSRRMTGAEVREARAELREDLR